jgi:hypothetical protein
MSIQSAATLVLVFWIGLGTVFSASAQDAKPGETVSLDRPITPSIPLALENAYALGTVVRISQFKGKIVVLRAVAPECGHWNKKKRPANVAYAKLYKEYHDRVAFIPVRTDFQHDTAKPYSQRLEEAAEFGAEMLPGDVYLVDTDSFDFLRFGTVINTAPKYHRKVLT